MPLQTANSLVESGWRERAGERSEPERERQLDSTAPNGSAAIPDPQVVAKTEKARRRRFTAQYKQRVLAEVEQAIESGAVGRILRREGLYHSQLTKWRQERAAGINAGLGGRQRGAKGPGSKVLVQENRKLQRENARLRKQLSQAEIIIDFQKKAATLFETTMEIEES